MTWYFQHHFGGAGPSWVKYILIYKFNNRFITNIIIGGEIIFFLFENNYPLITELYMFYSISAKIFRYFQQLLLL